MLHPKRHHTPLLLIVGMRLDGQHKQAQMVPQGPQHCRIGGHPEEIPRRSLEVRVLLVDGDEVLEVLFDELLK